ncbi:elongation factor P [uncultured Limosilactobacillus sp.]|uniref:elongation factor P n=1 Tax=uncultured Limosilactobacillus sp. TaxID=2837629 RepID=UPI0025D37118|nr:elongation factor P [uncultured Limosilactobacillus sp.]
MIQTIDLKKGMVFKRDTKLFQVKEINHHKPGKGNTLMQMKIKNLRNGAIVQTTMRPTEKVEDVTIDKKSAQYLYNEENNYVFMDLETYDQYNIDKSQIEEECQYLVPNMNLTMEFVGSELIGVELPATVTLKVAKTEPMIKGATIDGGGKPATMETGLVVNVPAFVKNGDELIINTTDASYKSRA